ncbi:MAG: PEP-CTERM sorting domain-containing protein [Aquabacterium sp.]|nr:PEP-CTERM sorting domain-containing protein [Aquabacterium sp.]
MSASGNFNLLTNSATPYTDGLLAMAPDRQSALFDVGFAGYMLNVPDSATTNSPQPVSQSANFMTFTLWSLSSGTTTYSRGIGFQTMGNPVSAQELQAWTPAEYMAYLQAHTGEVLKGAFSESYDYNSQSIFVIGAPLPSVNQHDNITIAGDAVIRSVTVVPEPATYALMGLGLSLMAWVRRRQTV